MAIDTEAKRWSIHNLASGPGYAIVINPSGSNLDSEVERLTLLKIYGGLTQSDTTAPVLSSPTGTATGSTTADGTVDTDEGNGTLYYWATQNATETAADIKANGSSQAVSATGTQNVSITGLTASTTYYLHYVQDDDATNESNVVDSASFATQAAPAQAQGTAGGGGGRVYSYPGDDWERSPQVAKIKEEIELLEEERRKAKEQAERIRKYKAARSQAARLDLGAAIAALNEQIARLRKALRHQQALEAQALEMGRQEQQRRADEQAERNRKRKALRVKRLKMISLLLDE
jgi:hypothetical protein